MKKVTPRPDTEANMIGVELTINQIVTRTFARTIRTGFQWRNPEWTHQKIATFLADGTLDWRYEQDVIVVRSADLELIAVLRELDDDEEETDEATNDVGFVIQPKAARD